MFKCKLDIKDTFVLMEAHLKPIILLNKIDCILFILQGAGIPIVRSWTQLNSQTLPYVAVVFKNEGCFMH